MTNDTIDKRIGELKTELGHWEWLKGQLTPTLPSKREAQSQRMKAYWAKKRKEKK